MRKVVVLAFMLMLGSAAFAADQVARWRNISGVITAPGVDNQVAGISAGGSPWITLGGHAIVDFSTGATTFVVEGLVLNGSDASGTRGPVEQVTGTLVCNAGTKDQAVLDTEAVALSQRGNAQFSGSIGTVPALCSNPLFLVRIANLGAFSGRWIATGEVLRMIEK
jgi:hypothetical protein